MEVLERWLDHQPLKLDPYLESILLHLRSYVDAGNQIANIQGKGDAVQSEQRAAVTRPALRFLGRLGGKNQLLVHKSEIEREEVLVAWDNEQRVKFDLQFPDMKISMFFGAFSMFLELLDHGV